MSLNTTLNIATSGMRAAQTGLRTVSDNITNVNTAGYARKQVQQQSAVISGVGVGVEVTGIRRATDLYLQKATYDASAEVGRAGVVAEILDRAQALFGDPSASSSFFNRLDPIFTAFSVASEDPTSSLRRSAAVFEVDRFFDQAAEIGQGLRELGRQVETRIGSVVDRANNLLNDINALNVEISRSVVTGRDASGAENVQSQLLDQLASLIDIRSTPRSNGGIAVLATDGTPLTGDNRGRLQLFSENGQPGIVRVVFEYGQPASLTDGLGSGELKGLIELRDTLLPRLGEQLGEFTARSADALNRAHNAASNAPAPAVLTGRATGVPLPNAIEAFTGRTAVAITDANGTVVRRVDIDFSNRTMSTDGAAAVGFSGDSFEGLLNSALSPVGGAVFSNTAGGLLSLSATGGRGVVVSDDPQAPSQAAGRSFSHYFGLNDLVQTSGQGHYETGLTAADPHGFASGGDITFRFNDGSGTRFPDATVAIPPGASLGDLLSTLNASTAVTKHGAFSLNNGVLRFTSKADPQIAMSVLEDNTTHAFSGRNLSQMHGMGAQRTLRAESFSVRTAVSGNPANLSLATFRFEAGVGQLGLSKGDGRGAFILAQAGEAEINFERAGDLAGGSSTLSSYAAQLGGAIGRRSESAEERLSGAEIVAREAGARRSSVEGVNLDEELIQLTVYQQAFNASARLITAVKEMYDVLLSIA
jgi:flagellar hook-associated protein 1 FlgK